MQRLPIIAQPATASPAESVLRAVLEATSQDVQIERWERKPHQLTETLGELVAPDVLGAMIGSPHKERVASLLGILSDDARSSGAVNVVVNADGRLRGHNTDVDGVLAGLTAILPRPTAKWPRQAVVLGAGGGARAVVASLMQTGFQRISVFNRHLHRAEALVAHFNRGARHTELRALPWHETIIEAELAKAPLLVNASGIGVEEGESPVPAALLPQELFVLDLVLNHPTTPLMRDASQRGGTVANGQGSFLVAQAASFQLWTGREAPAEVMRTALAAHLGLPKEGLDVLGD